MPATRTGRQSSPAKGLAPSSDDHSSPSKIRTQPMRSARLRSPSPFGETVIFDSAQSALPQASPSKRAAASSPSKRASAPLASKRSTRSRSRSVLSDGLSAIDENETVASRSSPIPAPQTDEASTISAESTGESSSAVHMAPVVILHTEASLEGPSFSLPTIAEDDDVVTPESTSDERSLSDDDSAESSSESESETLPRSLDEDETETKEDYMEELMKLAEQSYKSKTAPKKAAEEAGFESNQDMLHLGTTKTSNTIQPSANIPIGRKVVQKGLSDSLRKLDSKLDRQVDAQLEALESGALTTQSVKRSKYAKSPDTTAGSNWFDMPEFGASSSKLAANKGRSAAELGHSKVTGGDARQASAEQLRKEVQAIRLRNSLDPKRFYRASAKSQAMPKYAQLGKIIASPLEPKAVLSRKERGRTVVEELIRDAEAASYAKRKFTESQLKHKPSHSHRKSNGPPFKKRK